MQLSNTDAGAIYVFNDMQREFHLRATYAMDQALIDALSKQRIGLDETNVTLALAQREPRSRASISPLRSPLTRPLVRSICSRRRLRGRCST